MNETVKMAVTKGIPIAVGICAGSVIEKLIGIHIPEQASIAGKITQKIGIWGVGAVVSAAVMEQIEKEIVDALDIAEPVIDLFDPVAKPADVTVNPIETVEEEGENGGSTEA